MSGKSGAVVSWIRIEELPEALRSCVFFGARAKMSEGWAESIVWRVRYCFD
jgi:hypothetical protein